MTDNVTRFPGPIGYDNRDATCPGSVPSQGDNFRNARPVRLGDEIPADLAPVDVMDAARRAGDSERRYQQAKEEIDRAKAALDTALESVRAVLDDFDPRGGAA